MIKYACTPVAYCVHMDQSTIRTWLYKFDLHRNDAKKGLWCQKGTSEANYLATVTINFFGVDQGHLFKRITPHQLKQGGGNFLV